MKIKPGQYLKLIRYLEPSYIFVKSVRKLVDSEIERYGSATTHLFEFEMVGGFSLQDLNERQGGIVLENDEIPGFDDYEIIEANDATHLLLMVM
jgi:hypothetical protein